MSTLSSSSTLAEIKSAYLDNASYEEDSDPAKARGFVTACRLLLLLLPQQTSKGGAMLMIDLVRVQLELKAAQTWIATNPIATGGGGVRHTSFEDFRE